MTSRTGRSIKRPRWLEDPENDANPESPRDHTKSKAKVHSGEARAKASPADSPAQAKGKSTAAKVAESAALAGSPYSRRERVPKRTLDDEVGGFGVLIPKTRKPAFGSPQEAVTMPPKNPKTPEV